MESSENKAVVGKNQGLDWPIILFFILAYAIAWGALLFLDCSPIYLASTAGCCPEFLRHLAL
jgi:hypothetical protein